MVDKAVIEGATKVIAEIPAQTTVIEKTDKPPPEKRREPRQDQDTDPSRPARTTFQEDLVTAGQRNINFIWENTQGQIAKYVIFGTMLIDGVAVLMSILLNKDFTAAQGLTLGFVNSLATGVVSFYFSRTNHTATGGVGSKLTEMSESHR